MFQASFIKRASKLATPATAVATLSTIGVATTLWQNQDDKDIQLSSNNVSGINSMRGKVALCENNDKNNSVIGMLGDIKEKVSRCIILRVLNCCLFFFGIMSDIN